MVKRGTIDEQMLAEVYALRSSGVSVAVLTSSADTAPNELKELGLEFDAIFNSVEIRIAKPDRRAFEHVCAELSVTPSSVLFTDATQSKLQGTLEIGMTARLFESVEQFRIHLQEVGLTLG